MRVADEDELMARADKTLKKGRKAPVKKHTIDILSEPNPAKFSRERYEAEKMLRREEARVERERKARRSRVRGEGGHRTALRQGESGTYKKIGRRHAE